MLTAKVEYGTWKDGSSVFKDGKKGYYVVSIGSDGEEYKKYLRSWKPASDKLLHLHLDKSKKKWSISSSSKLTMKRKKVRPSPSVSAQDYCGKSRLGNDGNMYISKKNKNGICRWIKKIIK